MAFAQHLRLTMSGVFANSGGAVYDVMERWSIRLNLSAPNVALEVSQEALDDVVTDARAWWGRAGTNVAQSVKMTEVKLARIGPDGKYLEDSRSATFTQNGGGLTPAAPRFPSQIATVITLHSDRRGPTGRGRLYLPGFQGLMAEDYQLDAAACTALEVSTAQFIADLNNWPGVDALEPEVVIASSKGYNSKVTSVNVGRTLDTMRSRRTSIAENYGGATAVPGL